MDYRPRLVDAALERALSVFASVSIVGPRASGKTTTAARCAGSLVRLDVPESAAVFRADVDAALREGARPLLLDEWQDVPDVLGAVKRSVDQDRSPGQFILTGSVSAELDRAAWPGTGRLIRLTMGTMAECEVVGRVGARPHLRAMLGGAVDLPHDRPDISGYVERARRGGFPEVVDLDDDRDRRLWLDSYLDQLVSRDAARIMSGRDAGRLRRYLQAWALNSAGVVDDLTIHGAAGIDRRTHRAYEQLLQHLFIADLVPSWTSNRLKRLVLAPKRLVTDTGLMCAAARVGRADILREPSLLGRVIETFVTNELRSLALEDDDPSTLHHLRTAGGRQEIDLMLEYDGGNIIAMEIKSTSAPSTDDARHLIWLRDQLGTHFEAGVVFHTGRSIISLGDRIRAIPICGLWGTG